MFELKKIILDARELEHPKPLELAIKALRELNDENYFYMMHRKKPTPLLDLAREQGFSQITKEDKEGNWHILICKNKDIKIAELLAKHV